MPLRQVGAKTERWQRWREKSKTTVSGRARGRCEATGDILRESPDWHHLYNRDAEPWSSHPLVCLAVARHVHQDLENELLPALHDDLRWNALEKLAVEFGANEWLSASSDGLDSPMDAWRRLTAYLDTRWVYDPTTNRIVRVEAA